ANGRKPADRPYPQGSAVRALLAGGVEGDRAARGRDRPPRGQGDDARGSAGPRVLRPARGDGGRQEEPPASEHARTGRLLRRDRARLARAEDGDRDRDVSGARARDHRPLVQTPARRRATGSDQGDGGDGGAPRPGNALEASQDRAEAFGERVGNLLAERCGVLVRARRFARLREQAFEVELERAPLTGKDAGVELAEDSGRGPCRLAGMEDRVFTALESRLGLERLVEGLDDAFRACETAFRDGGDMQPL